MPSNEPPLFLLGPQPEYASLKKVLARLQPTSPVALITAGWETEENRDHKIHQAIGVDAINLNLFSRTEQLFADDPELILGLQARQDELRHLRDAYNDRLHHLLTAAKQILGRPESLIKLDVERESAIEMVRQLDRQHFVRTSHINDAYEDRLQIAGRPLVVEHRQELAELMSRCNALLIAGGHVAIILNRLKIFGILEFRPDVPIIAWSGGAMALSNQVVFFHDSPPQGAGEAEVLRSGMGLFNDILPLPDAKNRMNLQNRAGVELFARRFNNFKCVIFDEQTIVERKNGNWLVDDSAPVNRLGETGSVVEFNS